MIYFFPKNFNAFILFIDFKTMEIINYSVILREPDSKGKEIKFLQQSNF